MDRIDLKIGFQCNNLCEFCVQGDKRFRLPNKNLAEIKKALTEARSQGIYNVVFTGGEPTLYPHIIEAVSYAKKIGFQIIQLQSNGRLFAYKDFCQKIILAGANEFSPALHASQAKLHDRLTNSPGAWQQVVAGIKNLKQLNQYVLTNTVITSLNYKDLPNLARLFVQLNVDQFQFAYVHIIGTAWKNRQWLIPQKTKIMPSVKKGLDIGILAGKRVMTEAIPYCLMQGYEEYIAENNIPKTKVVAESVLDDYEYYRKNEGKIKSDECQECDYYKVCEGPWKEYPQIFGWHEFRPVYKVPADFNQVKKVDDQLVEKLSQLYNLSDFKAAYKYTKHSCGNVHLFIFANKKVIVKFSGKQPAIEQEGKVIKEFSGYFNFPQLFFSNENKYFFEHKKELVRVYEYIDGIKPKLLDNLEIIIDLLKVSLGLKGKLNLKQYYRSANVYLETKRRMDQQIKILNKNEVAINLIKFLSKHQNLLDQYWQIKDKVVMYQKPDLLIRANKIYLLESENLTLEFYPLTYALAKYLLDIIYDNLLPDDSLDLLKPLAEITEKIGYSIGAEKFTLLKIFILLELAGCLMDQKKFNQATNLKLQHYYDYIFNLNL
jgi:MoaA/NifB/PqqE/SkfB family radical SAM enzyme